MKSKIAQLIRCVLVPLIASSLSPISANAIPVVSLSVTPTSVMEGASFVVDATITGAMDLYAWQFDLGFTPDLVAASGDANERAFLASVGSTFFIPGFNDNAAGNVSATADTLLSAVLGANGDGTLVSFVFSAAKAGIVNFTLSNLILLDSVFNETPADVIGLSLAIGPAEQPPTKVPEPSTLALALAGFVGLAFRRWKRIS